MQYICPSLYKAKPWFGTPYTTSSQEMTLEPTSARPHNHAYPSLIAIVQPHNISINTAKCTVLSADKTGLPSNLWQTTHSFKS